MSRSVNQACRGVKSDCHLTSTVLTLIRWWLSPLDGPDTPTEQFSVDQLDRSDTLVFGRTTFEGMAATGPPKMRALAARSSPNA